MLLHHSLERKSILLHDLPHLHELTRPHQNFSNLMPKKHKRTGKLFTTSIDNRHHLQAIYDSSIAKSIQHPVQLIPCLNYSISVIAINHKNKTLSVLEVVPPQWTDLQIETKIIQQSHKPYNYKICSEGIRNMGAQLSGKIDIQHQPKEDMSTSAVKIK